MSLGTDRLGSHCDWDAAPPKGTQQSPSFRPMSIVAKRSPISATAELLFEVAVGQTVAVVLICVQHHVLLHANKYCKQLNLKSPEQIFLPHDAYTIAYT